MSCANAHNSRIALGKFAGSGNRTVALVKFTSREAPAGQVALSFSGSSNDRLDLRNTIKTEKAAMALWLEIFFIDDWG
jgi:hypothetical protein